MVVLVKKIIVKKDTRGWLAEIITPDLVRNNAFGLVFLTVAKPGQVKGKHYHKRKTEWFCVIRGNGLLTLINNETGKAKKIEMGEKNMVVVEIPPNHFHQIENTGRTEIFLLIYVNESFNPKSSDTYYDKA